ncbi:MAG: glycosyltransferase family 2 protein [Bacteriovoracia bacterium]
MARVDIVLPYYNGSAFIEDQLTSVSSNIDTRLIIVNDESSAEETQFLKARLPAGSLYLENPTNLGVIRSIERGLAASDADFVMLCDQDDVWLPGKIDQSFELIRSMNSDVPGLVFTDLRIVDKDLNLIADSMAAFYGYSSQKIMPSILFQNIVTGCTVIMNRKLMSLALPFPSSVTMHDHWLAICAVFGGEIQFLDQPTVLYRQHGRNQIGAPEHVSYLARLGRLPTEWRRFCQQTHIKFQMVHTLTQRLGKSSDLLAKIATDIENRNVIGLLQKGFWGEKIEKKILGSLYLLLLPRQR